MSSGRATDNQEPCPAGRPPVISAVDASPAPSDDYICHPGGRTSVANRSHDGHTDTAGNNATDDKRVTSHTRPRRRSAICARRRQCAPLAPAHELARKRHLDRCAERTQTATEHGACDTCSSRPPPPDNRHVVCSRRRTAVTSDDKQVTSGGVGGRCVVERRSQWRDDSAPADRLELCSARPPLFINHCSFATAQLFRTQPRPRVLTARSSKQRGNPDVNPFNDLKTHARTQRCG